MQTESAEPVVLGYRPQDSHAINMVNYNKQAEERLLRCLEEYALTDVDQRWLAIARTHFEQGFMALNRAIMQPVRIELPEDYPDTVDRPVPTSSGVPGDGVEIDPADIPTKPERS